MYIWDVSFNFGNNTDATQNEMFHSGRERGEIKFKFFYVVVKKELISISF